MSFWLSFRRLSDRGSFRFRFFWFLSFRSFGFRFSLCRFFRDRSFCFRRFFGFRSFGFGFGLFWFFGFRSFGFCFSFCRLCGSFCLRRQLGNGFGSGVSAGGDRCKSGYLRLLWWVPMLQHRCSSRVRWQER